MCYLLKKYFWWLLRRVKNLRSTACKHYRKCDVSYRYLHIELIWCLLMVQYLQNNVIMKSTTRFIRFTGWIPLKYDSITTPPIIAHCQKTPLSIIVFHIAISKTSNIRRTPSFDLLTDEFSKRVSILRPGLGSNTFYQIQIQIQIHFFPEFQIQIQIQIHRQKSDQIQIQIQIQLIKYKYKYKYTMRPRQNCRHFTDDILKFIVL